MNAPPDDESAKTRRFPGIAYRDGPTGRRAALVEGPDVWEVIRDVKASTAEGEERARLVAEAGGLTAAQVRLAVDFYAAYPGEIDERIEADQRAADRVRQLAARRQQPS